MIKVYVKENSWLAKLAAAKLRASKVAMVLGKTIYLHNTSYHEFMNNKPWVRHEVAHVYQYKKYRFIIFLLLYVIESIKNGYHANRFEVEARNKETDPLIVTGINFIKK